MHRIPAGLAPLLFIPGLAFEALLRARCALYSYGLLTKRRLAAPVISIGNITMGGSGKTPLVIHVAQILEKLGHTPAILSRGYGRVEAGSSRIVAPTDTIPSPAIVLGDEPALIRRHVPSAYLGISRNRFLAGSLLAEKMKRTVFILDDGFQHLRLHRDLDIVIVDGSQPLASNRVFPRGTLREPLSHLRRCQAVVINESCGEEKSGGIIEEIRQYHSTAAVFRCRQKINYFVPFSAWKEGRTDACLKKTVSQPAYLAAALGNPERFERDIRGLGIPVRGKKFFRDHHRLKPGDWERCIDEARGLGAEAIIVTEKDAVKTSDPPEFSLLVSIQATEISDAKEFELMLKKCIEGRG
ncbi:MAG: tetraacyldisaccharide 4'-kinase [Acidobacteria bacterium]|nr:tetraacyldisaccharide 4'-kinase [Acidobacteriota bacterium]